MSLRQPASVVLHIVKGVGMLCSDRLVPIYVIELAQSTAFGDVADGLAEGRRFAEGGTRGEESAKEELAVCETADGGGIHHNWKSLNGTVSYGVMMVDWKLG